MLNNIFGVGNSNYCSLVQEVSALLGIAGITAPTEILFISTFALSACSFWPFAHIATICAKEEHLPKGKKTFDYDFAIAILAFSLPISVSLILGIFSFQDLFLADYNLLVFASILLGLALLPYLYLKWRKVPILITSAPSKSEGSSWDIT